MQEKKEDELRKLVEELVKSMLESTEGKQQARVWKGEVKLKRVDPSSPHGIYVYDKESRAWILKKFNGSFKPWKDCYYAIYFDNALCPACRVHDLAWFTYVELFGRKMEDVEFVVVLCGWFARECNSSEASTTFKKFEVRASPTTVLILVENGKVKEKKVIRGAKTLSELLDAISSFVKT